MTSPDPAVLDRIRKLLALAGSPNVHEAAAAAARAQALVTRHRLEEWIRAEEAVEEDPDPITDGREAPLEVGRKARKWKQVLAAALAEVNGCVAWTWDGPEGQAICVVGRDRDRAAVSALWDGLVRRIEWLSATAGPGKSRRWHEAFRVGVVDAIVERLRASEAEIRADLPATALARVDPHASAHAAALDRFVEQHLGRGRGRSIRVDARAWDAGRRAGRDLPLPK